MIVRYTLWRGRQENVDHIITTKDPAYVPRIGEQIFRNGNAYEVVMVIHELPISPETEPVMVVTARRI